MSLQQFKSDIKKSEFQVEFQVVGLATENNRPQSFDLV